MLKSTPGPWFYDSGAIYSEVQLDPNNPQYLKRGEEPIAEVIMDNPSNARLIAAAPLMLEALEELASNHGGLSDDNYNIVKAAIRSARGEE